MTRLRTEFLKYLVSGGLAFLCDVSVLYACTQFFLFHYLVSNIFGYGAGMMVAYTLNTRWVFSHRKYKHAGLEFAIFNGIVIVGLGLSELMMFLLVDRVELDLVSAKVISSAVLILFNYGARKFILFRPARLEGV